MSTTYIIGIIAFVCFLIGGWRRGGFQYLRMPISQYYRGLREGTIAPTPAWQQALQWLGLGLLVLSQWRACSGV